MSGKGFGLASVGAFGILLLFTTACSNSVEVVRPVSPKEAGALTSERFLPVSVLRGDARLELPPRARVSEKEVEFDNPNPLRVHLEDGDTIVEDERGQIVAVRSARGDKARFVPKTAESVPGSGDVEGRPAEPTTRVPLLANDRIELAGRFEVGEALPGGGRVEGQRHTSLLVGGLVLFGLSYGTSAYVGATSSLDDDRVLLAPIVGPWIDLATRPSCTPPAGSDAVLPVDPCAIETASRVGLVASGVGQGLGALFFALGLPHRAVLVDAPSGVHVAISPSARGLQALGRF